MERRRDKCYVRNILVGYRVSRCCPVNCKGLISAREKQDYYFLDSLVTTHVSLCLKRTRNNNKKTTERNRTVGGGGGGGGGGEEEGGGRGRRKTCKGVYLTSLCPLRVPVWPSGKALGW